MNELVDGRQSVYGDPVQGHIRIAQVWSGILGTEVAPEQVPLMMAGLKLVRASENPTYSDNSDDVDGYMDIFRRVVGGRMVRATSVEGFLRHLAEKGSERAVDGTEASAGVGAPSTGSGPQAGQPATRKRHVRPAGRAGG